MNRRGDDESAGEVALGEGKFSDGGYGTSLLKNSSSMSDECLRRFGDALSFDRLGTKSLVARRNYCSI